MASFDRCSSKILWIIMQVMFNLTSPYATFSQFRSYASSVDHFPRLHPSENPHCPFQSSVGEVYDRKFKYQESFSIDHETLIEIRSILVPCPGSFGKTLEESSRVSFNETFYEASNTTGHEQIRNCHQKLIITLKLNNVGKVRTEDEYIVVSHALDPITMQKSRLQSPYIVKIRREPVLQLYGIKFERVVNAEAKEEIIINKRSNYTGCNDGTENPTCGLLFDNGVPVPFSQGFCCPCGTGTNTTRQTRKSKEWAGNFSTKVETILEESANNSSNRSKSRAAYDRPFDDPKLSTGAEKKRIGRKQGHLIYNSRKLKENNAGNNVSMIGNIDNDINGHQKTNKNDIPRLVKKSVLEKDSDMKSIRNFLNKNDDGLDNITSPLLKTILFSPKMQTKGKIEPYMDAIQEEALRESRNLQNIEDRISFDYKDSVIESPLSLEGSRFENYEKKKKRKMEREYGGDRIDDDELGRKNLMDELTELEKAYDALKKMRSKKGEHRSSKKDESCSGVRKDLEGKQLELVNNIENNSKKTFVDKKKMDMNARVNDNKMRESERCFRLRKNEMTKKKKKKKKKRRMEEEDREDSNSVKSTETLTSRLDEFQARSRLGGDGKIYEDQSRDIEVPERMEFTKYIPTNNASISGIAVMKLSDDVVVVGNEVTFDDTLSTFSSNSNMKCDGKMIECSLDSYESEMFTLLTKLLVPEEEISRSLKITEDTPIVNKYSNAFIMDDNEKNEEKCAVKRGTSDTTASGYDGSNGNDFVPRFATRIKKSMRDGNKKIKSRKKHGFSPLSSSRGNLIKNLEIDSRENDGPRSIRVYVQQPAFDFVTDKYLNEPSTDSNASDNPFLMDEGARRNSIDRRIEEKFGRISEVLKEASDEAKNIPVSPENEITNVIDEKIQKGDVPKNKTKGPNFDISKNKDKIRNDKVSKYNGKVKNVNVSGDMITIQNVNTSETKSKIQKLTIPERNPEIQNFNISRNFDKTERNENAGDRIEHVEISSGKVPTTNFVEFKGGTRPLEKVIPCDKSSFPTNPVNGVERYTKKRPGESADRINVRASNGSKQISDLIISRSRLNSTMVVVGDSGSRPGRNGVSYLDFEKSGIVLRKINSSDDTKTKLLCKRKERRKTFGRRRIARRSDTDVAASRFDERAVKNGNSTLKESQKLADHESTNNINNDNKNYIKETRHAKPREVIFYEYDFEDENDDDDDSHDFGKKSRKLLSIRFDDTINEENEDEDELNELLDDDSQNFEYQDYSYPKTDATKDNEDDSMDDIFDFNSMTPSKRKTRIDGKTNGDFNKDTNLNNLNIHDADKYIEQMSEVLAHRNSAQDSRSNKYQIKNNQKIASRGSKIVKKHVNDVPIYDSISTQQASNDDEKMKNFNQVKNLNFIPENWNGKMNIDDPEIYEKKFDQNRERKEESSLIGAPIFNAEDEKPRSSKSFDDKPMIEKQNEFLVNSREKSDGTAENIDISVNGNIHVEGGIKGHPISIAFVAVPDTQPDSPMIINDSYVGVPKSDDAASGIIKLNEIVPNGANDQDDSGSNVEEMPNVFTNDLDRSREEPNSFLMNNNNDEELFGRNSSLFSSLGRENHLYNDVYKSGGIERSRDGRVTPVQRFFVFNSKLNEADAKDPNTNDNSESSIVEEDEDDTRDTDSGFRNLAREKKEVEGFGGDESKMADEITNLIEKQSNDSLPVNNENVTVVKIIPEKLFNDIPSAMKNDFSNNFEINPYGENVSSLEFPSLSNPTSMRFDSAIYYENATSNLGSYDLTNFIPSSIIFPIIFETTMNPSYNLQDWYKEMTTISKIKEPDVIFQTMTTPARLSISDIQLSLSKERDNVNSSQTKNESRKAEKSQIFNQTSSTSRPTNLINGDSCYKMTVTVKKLNLSETTTRPPTTVKANVETTVIQNIERQNQTSEKSGEKNSSQTQNSKIRERNASTIANFIKKLQAFASNNTISRGPRNKKTKSQRNIKEIIVVPEDINESNITAPSDALYSRINCKEVTDEKDKIKSESGFDTENHLDDVIVDPDKDKSVPIFLSSSNYTLENLPIASRDSTKGNKLKRKTIPESNPELLSPTSKGSFYPSWSSTSRKVQQQQQQQSSSGSSSKRSLSVDRDGPDESFLFYARQKQPVGLPVLLVKSKDENDIDWDIRSFKKQVFLGRDKRNERKEVGFQSSGDKTGRFDEVSPGRPSDLKEEAEVKSRVNSWKKKKSARELTRPTEFNKRKLEKRKKKMDVGEIKKLTGIRRRKKKKKKKMGNQENTLDIPEAKAKWRLVKRNLLSVGGTESGSLKRKVGKKRDDGDLEITRKTYEESNASQVGRISGEDGGLLKTKRRKKERKKKETKKEEKVEDAGSTLIRRRKSRTDGKQVRGGQDCSNRDHPVDVDESKYSESAHCLRFSDLWYSVYRLEGPILDHGVSVQLYEKRSLPDGTARWENLTPSMIRLNTFSRRYRNNDDSLAFSYRAKREPSKQFPASLDVLEDRLLVPSSVSSEKAFKVAKSKGTFEEYLIVRASEISTNGNECDKIGVGFKAFVDQPDRCGRLEGTCLKNQPLSYWKRDREAREAGRTGCYFLSNFASVPSEPIKYNVSGSGSGEFLALEYHSPHVSAIDIEVRNDYNGFASAGPLGRISHIYVDSTSPVHTLVTIVIRNVGSTPTVYRPRIVECPRGLPVSWSNARGIVQMILPKQNSRVAFDLYGELPFNEFECTVELLDRFGKTVATRKMKVGKMNRCFCVWYCLCACVGDADGSSCRPMSTTHYLAAGFQPPVPTTPTRSSSFLGSLLDILLFLFSMLALLLAMGISKWIIGIYVPAVGRWGLDTLLESTRMSEYFEEELKCRCIVTDESGLPVHPDTRSRSIRICSRKVECFLNITFFLIYPIAVCLYGTKKIFHWSRGESRSTSNDESKACLTSDRDEYQNLVTVSTYGDGRNSKMETEDTNYVMNELKKSQESLQEYNRYKRFRYYMENQDSRY